MRNKALLFVAVILGLGLACAPVFAQTSNRSASQGLLLTINVNVPDAKIVVDNAVVTGGKVSLPAGPHTLVVTAPGYQDYTQRVELRSSMVVNVTLQPAYSITVNASVQGAVIFIDGAQITGTTAIVTKGSHAVRVTAAGYKDYIVTVNVTGPVTLNAQLVASTVALTVNVNVRNATVFIDGAQISGYIAQVTPGTHTVRVSAPGFQDYQSSVNVTGPLTVNAQLVGAGYMLTVNTNVKDADIYVDGALISGNALVVSKGTHSVKVSAPGYQDYQSSVNVTGPMTVNAVLASAGYMLTINSNVQDADIYVDGAMISGNALVVSRGNHSVKVSAAGYIDYQTTVNVNGPTIVNAQLTGLSYQLTIICNVKAFTVFVDNVQSPSAAVKVGPGSHTIRVSAAGYQDYTTTVDVAGPLTINAQLSAAGYNLTITSNVIGASVFINNVEKGETPYSELLPGGAYTISVSAPGFKTYTTSLTLNGPITVSARLTEAPPATVSLVLPRGLLDPQGHEFNQIKVYIDGKVTNVKRDLTGISIPAGRHKIAVSSGDLYVQSADIDLEGGKSYTLELFMELRLGTSH